MRQSAGCRARLRRQPPRSASTRSTKASGCSVCTRAVTPIPHGEAQRYLTALPVPEGPIRPRIPSNASWRATPKNHRTVSSEGAACLPTFDADGRLAKMDTGRVSALLKTLAVLLDRWHPLEAVLPILKSNVADVLCAGDVGRQRCRFLEGRRHDCERCRASSVRSKPRFAHLAPSLDLLAGGANVECKRANPLGMESLGFTGPRGVHHVWCGGRR